MIAQEFKPVRFDSLTGLRGILAALVVVCHGYQRVGWLELDRIDCRVVAEFGHIGVVCFFVLSGFILSIVYSGRNWTLREFASNRFARIYPLYLVCLLFTLPIDWFSPGFPSEGRLGALALSGVLEQAWFPFANGRFNGPGWTLSVEFFFYASFPLLFPLTMKRPVVFRLLCVAAAGATAWFWDSSVFWLAHRFPLMRIWEFMLGMALAGLFVRTRSSFFRGKETALGLAVLAGGIALVVLLAERVEWDFAKWLAMAAVAAATIWLLAASDRSGAGWRPLAGQWWILAGETSYGLYLLHDGVQRYSRVAIEKLGHATIESTSAGFKVAFILGTGCTSVVAAYLLWRMVEVPARRYFRRRLNRRESA